MLSRISPFDSFDLVWEFSASPVFVTFSILDHRPQTQDANREEQEPNHGRRPTNQHAHPLQDGMRLLRKFSSFISLFPVRFSASPPRYRVVAESVRPLLSRVTSSWLHVRLAQEIPKPSGAFLASGQVGEDDPRRRGCTIHGGGGHGGKAHFQNSGRSLSVIRGSGRTVLRVSEPIVLTHNTGRIVPGVG